MCFVLHFPPFFSSKINGIWLNLCVCVCVQGISLSNIKIQELSLSVCLSLSHTHTLTRTHNQGHTYLCSKIQGDGRKFLDHFKSYFGSKISSQSLNEIHIYRLQPKSATNGDFFHIFLSLIVSSSRRMVPFDD